MRYSDAAGWIRARLWIAVVAGCVPWLVWLGGLAYTGGRTDLAGKPVGVDHLAFFHAAKHIRDGHADRLYSYDVAQAQFQQEILGWGWDGFEAYRNPPFYALLYLPTAGLSYYASFVIWSAVSFALLALAIHLLKTKDAAGLNPAARHERPPRALLWSLTFYPAFAVISFGQNTFISLAIFAGVYRLLADDRRFAAGLVAGLLFFKPQLLLGLFVWWAFQPRRFAATWLGVFVTGCALAAVSWLAVPDGSRAFVDNLRGVAGMTGEDAWNKHSPRAFWAMLLTHPMNDRHPAVLALAAACSLAGVAVAWWLKRRTGAPVAVMFPVAVFLSLWASPHAMTYEWALLIAAAVVLWERFPASRDAWLCLFTLAWVAMAVSTTAAKGQLDAKWPVVVQLSVPLLGLVGWLAAKELARSGEAQARAAADQLKAPSQSESAAPVDTPRLDPEGDAAGQ